MRNDFCSGYLEHSAKGTTWKKGTSYIKKEMGPNGKMLYFYSQAEYSSYKKNGSVKNVLSNKERNKIKSTVTKNSAATLTSMAKNDFRVKGNTTAEKAANLKKSIANGEKIINGKLNGASKSSKKGSGGSSKSSKEKNIGKAKGSSGSKSSKEKAAKEKSAKEKAAKAEKTSKTTTKKERNTTPINMDTLKKVYGLKDEDVNSFSGSVSEFKSNMLSKYDEGSFGYLTAGDATYKWTISGGKLVIKDYNSDKEVSADEYMKDVKEFKEFQSNKKKKK